ESQINYFQACHKVKRPLLTILTVLILGSAFGQRIISGDYDPALKLSYDSSTKKVTGYFEMYGGWDDQNKNPRFSCVFYIDGIMSGRKFNVNTYCPSDKLNDTIPGTMEIISKENVKIKLNEEQCGCWNVQHFADEPTPFTLKTKNNWVQIRYVETD